MSNLRYIITLTY